MLKLVLSSASSKPSPTEDWRRETEVTELFCVMDTDALEQLLCSARICNDSSQNSTRKFNGLYTGCSKGHETHG
jgi:hypothetical protein